ncbi:MAG TPA: S1 RNA-binding domain-containing protein [Roseiflexaceae bacterium]|nr:S1 RNA-binding domain-containing protein [Roseiflexaceae bacterium]
MTDQERPVEERKELLDDLLNAAVSVEEPKASQQTGPAQAEAQEVPAESAATAGANEAAEQAAEQPAAEQAAEQPAAAQDMPAAEQAAEQPAAAQAAGETRPAINQPVPATAAGASYAGEGAESGRPRRVKDLEPGMELEGRVTSIALYGIFVDIGVGRDGLVHISEMSDTRIDSPSDVVKIGDRVTVRVKSVEPDGRRISLTMRSKERQAEGRGRSRGRRPEPNKEALSNLRVGDNVEGTITGIAPFGVFVDIGVGKDGLVHVSELAEGRVERAEDVVKVGETYTFKVLEVDADGARISLSLRRAQRSQRMQQLQKGQILEGTVSGLAPFGAFVDIGVGRDGLVHISELTEGRVGRVEDAVKVGDKVTVRVLDVDTQTKRISLTMRLEDKPQQEEPAATSEPQRYGRQIREERFQRPPREERTSRPPRQERQAERAPETYTSDEPDEPFSGDATLEDLVSKFGRSRTDRKRRQDEEEDEEDRFSRRQREAQRRTLQSLSDEE